MFRKKRVINPASTDDSPSSDSQNPRPTYTYIALKSRYLSRSFFTKYCLGIVEIIDYYGLNRLVYCSHSVNISLCTEFYNNLVKIDDLIYSSSVSGRDIMFSPSVLSTHLGLRQSACPFLCYPPRDLPFAEPYSHITLDMIYAYFFEGVRVPTVTEFKSVSLRVQDYVLYRVLVTCILPVSSRNIAMMRPSQSFFLYALCQRLDIDISLHMFHNIIYTSSIVTNKRIHMPYCHILTSLFETLGIDTTQGTLIPLNEYDMIGHRQLSLAHIDIDAHEGLSWKGGNPPAAPVEGEEVQEPEDIGFTMDELPTPLPTDPLLDERLSRLEETSLRLEQSVSSLRGEVTTGFQRMDDRFQILEDLIRSLSVTHPPPPDDES